jgi:hypothetical protein
MASNQQSGTNRRRKCPNCYYPLPHFGSFCAHCGQKYTDGKVTFGSLVRDFFAGVLNLENRLWRTLGALLVPGKLTKAFFKGQQNRYVTPLRLFFITALIFFASITYGGQKLSNAFVQEATQEQRRENYFSLFLDELRLTADTLGQQLPAYPDAPQVLDSLYQRLHGTVPDSMDIGIVIQFGKASQDITSFPVAKKDIANMSPDSLVNAYATDRTYLERLILRQNLRLQQQGASFMGYVGSQMVWMMLLMMPVLALILKLLYIRHRKYYYVEHLIFSFHTHAFLFSFLTVGMLLEYFFTFFSAPPHWLPDGLCDALKVVLVAGIPVYFYLSMLKVYGQSKIKTFAKFVLLVFFYLILFSFAISLTLLGSALAY